MSKNYLVPTNVMVSLDLCPLSSAFGNVCARGSGIKSVSGDDLLLELLGLKPTTRSTTSLCESVSTSESDELTCYSTFLSGGLPRLLTLH